MQVAIDCSYKLGQKMNWCKLGWFLHGQSHFIVYIILVTILETNVELIRQVLEAKEHEGILDTLSDDEGDGEDEDEQEDDSKPDNDEPSEEVPATTGSNNA